MLLAKRLLSTVIFSVTALAATSLFANPLVWKHKNWEIYDEHGLIRYVSEPNATEVRSEVKTFGFFKVPGKCDADYLWLVLPGQFSYLNNNHKKEFTLDFRVDPYAEGNGLNQSYKLVSTVSLEQIAKAQGERGIGQFQAVLIDRPFIEALRKGARLMLTIGPKDGQRPSSGELDEVHAFSLFGMVAARLKAYDLCVAKQ